MGIFNYVSCGLENWFWSHSTHRDLLNHLECFIKIRFDLFDIAGSFKKSSYYDGEKDKVIDNYIASWLRGTRDREGGRLERILNNACTSSM